MRKAKQFEPHPFAYHEEVELEVENLTNLGLGVGRVLLPDGGRWVVQVPFVLPGERVRCRIWRNHKNFSEGDLVEVLRCSEERVQPHCELFQSCGGCQYQHLAYAAQLRWKEQQVRELFQRLAGIEQPPVEAAQGSPKEYGYRSKLTPHYDTPRGGQIGLIGFQRPESRRLVDVPHCPIATEGINAELPQVRARLRESKKLPRRGGTLLLRETREGVTCDHSAAVSEEVCGRVFQFTAGEFFQNNPFILPILVDYVLGQAVGESADAPRFLVDAYCGVGVFALCGANRFDEVAGIEVNARAVAAANSNAALNHITNVRFAIGEAQAIFSRIQFSGEQTSVIIDPPRRGCDEDFLRQLCQFAPRRIVYVSCGPDTQARDVAFLSGVGYELSAIKPFDLFPQTRHIESVATLQKRA